MELHAAFSALTQSRELILNEASTWTQTGLTQRSNEQSWSALELIDHLARTERSAAVSIEQSLRGDGSYKGGEDLRRYLLFTIMCSPLRVKVPKGAADLLPEVHATLASAAGKWMQASHDLAIAVNAAKPQKESTVVFRHPVGGKMSLSSTMTFLALHLQHHRFQWERLRRAAA